MCEGWGVSRMNLPNDTEVQRDAKVVLWARMEIPDVSSLLCTP